jgi:hypothetical protein
LTFPRALLEPNFQKSPRILRLSVCYGPVFIGMNSSSGLTLHPCLPILGAKTIKVFIYISENKL